MPLQKCPVCDENVATSALTCPHCGHPVWTKNLSALRRPFLNRIKKMRAVWKFTIVALLISVAVWISDPWLFNMLALQPIGGGGANSLLPIAIIAYAFVHPSVVFLISSLIAMSIFRFFVEPRMGSRVTKWLIISGIITPAVFWLPFGHAGFLTGSSGVSYALLAATLAKKNGEN